MPDAPTPLDLDAIRDDLCRLDDEFGLEPADVRYVREQARKIRDEVARAVRSVTDHWDEPLDEVHDVPPIADTLLARFTMTPKEDR